MHRQRPRSTEGAPNGQSRFKGKSATIAEIGQALNVATVVEGSVRKSGNRARIAVQLIKVADGYNLWLEKCVRLIEHELNLPVPVTIAGGASPRNRYPIKIHAAFHKLSDLHHFGAAVFHMEDVDAPT